jgi:hypothetical protein
MFQQLKSIAKQVVANGEEREGHQSDHNADETPRSGFIHSPSGEIPQRSGKKHKGKNLQCCRNIQRQISNQWRFQSRRGEVLLELRKPIPSNPQKRTSPYGFIHDIEQPEAGPENQNCPPHEPLLRPHA